MVRRSGRTAGTSSGLPTACVRGEARDAHRSIASLADSRSGTPIVHGGPSLTGKVIAVGIVNPARRARLLSALAQRGAVTREAPTGFHLLDVMADCILDPARSRPDAVVAEALSPGCTGLSIVVGLRDLDWQIPIILLYPAGNRRIRTLARKSGASAVLDSNSNPGRVSQTIARCIEHPRKRSWSIAGLSRIANRAPIAVS